MTKRKVTEYIAWGFLASILFIVLMIVLAGTNVGLRSAAYFANQVEGVSVTNIKGSIYSQVYLGRVQINIDEGLSIDVADIEIDISLSCLLDVSVCMRDFSVNKLELTLPIAKDDTPSGDPLSEYISLPFPVDIKKVKINQFTLLQRFPSEQLGGSSTSKVLSFKQLALDNIFFFERLRVDQVLMGDLLLFASPQLQEVAPKQVPASSPAFSPSQLQDALKTPPSVRLPKVFIPVNALIKKTQVKRLCWQVQTEPEAKNCVNNTVISLNVQEQNLETRLTTEADAFFKSMGIIAQSLVIEVQLNAQQDWRHDLKASLMQNANNIEQAELIVSIVGNAEDTEIRGTILQGNTLQGKTRSPLISANLMGQWHEPKFPIRLNTRIEDLSPLKRFLGNNVDFEIAQASVSLSGNWEEYNLSADAQLINSLADKTGLSTLQLVAKASPAKQTLAIESFQTDGELGQTSIDGSVALQALSTSLNTLAVNSKLNVRLKNLNLGVLNADLQSQIDGQFALSHTFTEQWMEGELLCKDVKGSFIGFPLSIACDVSIAKTGELTIKQLALNQADSKVSAVGQLLLPHTEYLRLTGEELLQTEGQVSLDIDVPDLSKLDKRFVGLLQAEGSFSGTVEAPNIDLTSNIDGFAFDNLSLEQANVSMSLDAKNNFAGSLKIQLSKLMIDTLLVDSSAISVDGDKDEHTIDLVMQNQALKTSQTFIGGLTLNSQVTRWRGTWLQGLVSLPFTEFSLDSEVSIVAGVSEQNLSLSDHCWLAKSTKDSICLSDLEFANDTGAAFIDIAYDIASIARHYAPEIVLPDTHLPLQGDIALNYSKNDGLSLTAFNNIIGGRFETNRKLLELTAIVANFTLQDQLLSSAVYAGSAKTGTLGLQSKLDLRPAQRNHDGRLRIDQFDLNLLQQIIPSTQSILGMVNADIGFTGPLLEPELSGELLVSNGELILDAYTYPLTDFHHSMTFTGKTAAMNGGFQLGKGKSSYKADLNLGEPFSIEGELNGEDMQFAFSKSKAQISPNLTFMVSPTDLVLKGNIAIPTAEIKVEELPENAKTPSSDTIIIGQKAPEPIIPLAMDIDLIIQIDKPRRGFVKVNALDLKATLAGDLALKVEQKRSKIDNSFQALRTSLNGQVNVLDGSYEAYGQMLVVRSGKIFFNGEPSLPQFDIRAIRNPLNTEGDVIAGIYVSGNPVVPRVELFSEPPMTQAKQLSYLLQGRDFTSRAPNSGSSSDTALINALIGFGVGRSENRLGQIGNALGFDSLNLQTAGSGENSQVQITGRISEDIQITYGVGVFDQASEVILKYQIMPQLFIEAKSGVDSAVDLFYQISRGEVN